MHGDWNGSQLEIVIPSGKEAIIVILYAGTGRKKTVSVTNNGNTVINDQCDSSREELIVRNNSNSPLLLVPKFYSGNCLAPGASSVATLNTNKTSHDSNTSGQGHMSHWVFDAPSEQEQIIVAILIEDETSHARELIINLALSEN